MDYNSSMSTQTRNVALIIIGVIILFAIGMVVLSKSEQRQGTEQLTAEQVVDLEVQAQQEYEQAGGTY